MIPEPEDLAREYTEAREEFKRSVGSLVELHAKSRHLPMKGAAHLARLLFARQMLVAGNMLRLCPEFTDEMLWDFTSIALLGRNLFETIMFFRYFIDNGELEEWQTRIAVLRLFDANERVRLFTKLKRGNEVASFTLEVERVRDSLKKIGFFQNLDKRRKKELLNGSRGSILTLSEMAERYASQDGTWVIHQLLSHYSHSHPMSFMRNNDDRRDGLPNDLDRMYIPGVLRWLTELLDASTAAYRNLRIGMPEPASYRTIGSGEPF